MFTGIVEEVGRVVGVDASAAGARLRIRARTTLEGTALGDSIAVEGVCLTVTEIGDGTFDAELAPETLSRTHLGQLTAGDAVNLERSLAADGRFGGHFVQGHVDATGRIRERRSEGNSLWLILEADADFLRWVVPKGYVAVDGISLTVVDVSTDWFSLMLVPHTQDAVTLAAKPVGAPVNLEADILGKYVDKLLGDHPSASKRS